MQQNEQISRLSLSHSSPFSLIHGAAAIVSDLVRAFFFICEFDFFLVLVDV